MLLVVVIPSQSVNSPPVLYQIGSEIGRRRRRRQQHFYGRYTRTDAYKEDRGGGGGNKKCTEKEMEIKAPSLVLADALPLTSPFPSRVGAVVV